jgi:hypothetical protein
MRLEKLNTVWALLLISLTIGQYDVSAQWAEPYANNWIAYNKPYVKIGIAKRGIHRIPLSSLPKDFPVSSPEKLQLWRRGKQVSIISTSNNEILFYGLPNDGASDSLLYKPMSSRMNPYSSMYSDEGSYFLTLGDSDGLRAKVVNQAADNKLTPISSHDELATKTFQQHYSLSTQYPIRANFFNSYFELGASKTGVVQLVNTMFTNEFTLQNFAGDISAAFIKLLVHGRSNNDRNIEVYVGKNAQSLRLVHAIPNSGFSGSQYQFNLKEGDIDENKKGVLALKTVATATQDRFSLAYFSAGFKQALNLNNQTTKEFWLPATDQLWSRLPIIGTLPNGRVLDISEKDNPVVLQGSLSNLMVPRTKGKILNLYLSNEVIEVAASKIKSVKMSSFDPKASNYVIIAAESLLEGAKSYADYRASAAGGGFKPIVVNVTDVYNQFNYGEPSPLAIKKFMAYMIGRGGRDKYLFLMGKSITHNERMKRELPDEVPTIGYPASDMLLVEGFPGVEENVPAIPVGRLSAITVQQIQDYLQKVKEYEQNKSGEYGWRKNVLHLNGGKNTGEITQLKELLAGLEPSVEAGVIGGKVKPYVKQQAMAEVEPVNITPDVNNGVGLITYFGHGSPTITDLDMGYITDAARGYDNAGKYPMMYFNGCGVGNIFSARFSTNPSSTDRMTLSLDWILAPNRGTVAIIANSFESFVSPSSRYLQQLYHHMFVDPATVNLSIGKIQQAVAKEIVSKDRDKYSIANVHQSLLQGDPALRLVTVDKPDYALEPEQSITLYSQNAGKTIGQSDSIRLGVIIKNKGRFVAGQNVPVEISLFSSDGTLLSNSVIKSFPYEDTLTVSFKNNVNLKTIRVHIDPKYSLSELNIRNNMAELEIDWEAVKDRNFYSSANNKDIIAPILTVKFNDKILVNGEEVAGNPELTFELQDDRQLFADTSLIEVFIKRCADNSCDFEKVVYKGSEVRMDSISNYFFKLNLLTKGLGIGEYELLVNAKDLAGNAIAQAYRISFRITDSEVVRSTIVVSPNPASSYLRFEVKAPKSANLKSARYILYNQAGVVVADKQVELSKWSATMDIYWEANGQPSGLYSYKLILFGDKGQMTDQFTGKVALIR